MLHGHYLGTKNQEGEPDLFCQDPACPYPEVLPTDIDAAVKGNCECCGESITRPKYAFSDTGWETLCLRCDWADISCPKGAQCLGRNRRRSAA